MFKLLVLLFFLLPSLGYAASGVQGRVAWRGQLVEGLKIYAYASMAELVADQPLAVSAPTALDGTYQLDLPTGKYFLLARDFTDTPQPGKHFCYYSGSPVQVDADGFRQVGFNLIKIPQETASLATKRSGLQGRISYQGEPLEQSYLYVYRDYNKNFKGPAYFIQPVAKGGFRLSLPPGEYYLLARKRARGGQFGPVEIDDHFNYYYGNPLRIEKNLVQQIELETIKRLAMLEEEEIAFQGLTGQIVGSDGKGVAGLRVFAYRQLEMNGMPDFFSPVSDDQGFFRLPIPEFGSYNLLARKSFGGPAGGGELYGKYHGNSEHRVELNSAQPVQEIRIDVAPSL